MSTPESEGKSSEESDASWLIYAYDEDFWRDMFKRNRIRTRVAQGRLDDLLNDQSPELIMEAKVATARNMLEFSKFWAGVAAYAYLQHKKKLVIE